MLPTRRGSGSALLDKIRADHDARWRIWRRGAPPKPKLPPPIKPLPKWDIKPLSVRLEEVEKYHGLIPRYSVRAMKRMILGSAIDLGEQAPPVLPPEVEEFRQGRVADVQRAVARHFESNREAIVGPSRKKRIILIRHVGMYLCRTLTSLSCPEIGRRFGGRDHTTVLYAVRKIADLIKTDERLAADVAKLTEMLKL
jgi:hypothetical protein